MELTRELWRENWLSSVNELTSLDLQLHSWLDNKQPNPHWSYVEFVNCYFDTVAYPYQWYLDKNWISPEEYEIICDWHESLNNYQEPKWCHEVILKDENWLSIVEKGAKAKDELSQLLNSHEREILLEDIDYLKINEL